MAAQSQSVDATAAERDTGPVGSNPGLDTTYAELGILSECLFHFCRRPTWRNGSCE